MEEKNKELKNTNQLCLIDLFAVLVHYKIMIITIVAVSMISIVTFCLISKFLPTEKSPMPNIYMSKAEMLISENSNNNNMSSILNQSGLGSLASMVGVSSGMEKTNANLAQYLVYSKSLLDELNKKFNFTEKYNIDKSPLINTRNAIKKVLKTEIDEATGIFFISFEDTNPVFAKEVVNYTVKLLEERFLTLNIDQSKITQSNLTENISMTLDTINSIQDKISNLENSVSDILNPITAPSIAKETSMLKLELDAQKEIYKQLKAQQELLKVELSSEKPIFQIIEYAEVPDKKSSPSRGKICIIGSFLALLIAIMLSFFLNSLHGIKNDPIAMKKLKGE